MKLCRFEVKAEPGRVRSGMVYAGKVYETDGANALGVYEADGVRPLSPIPLAPSLRIFHRELQSDDLAEGREPRHFYGNPGCLVGSSQLLNDPGFSSELGFDPYVAAVMVSDAYAIEPEEAEEAVLGYTILNLLVARDVQRQERVLGGGFGRSMDIAGVIGPVITTPDELEEDVVSLEGGRAYSLDVIVRVNSVEVGRGSTGDLPFTFAEAISAASRSCTLRTGDIVAIGPVGPTEKPPRLDPGDEVQVAVGKLGTLSLKLSSEA